MRVKDTNFTALKHLCDLIFVDILNKFYFE